MVPKFTGTKCSVFRAQPGRVSAPPINFGSVVIGGFFPSLFSPWCSSRSSILQLPWDVQS